MRAWLVWILCWAAVGAAVGALSALAAAEGPRFCAAVGAAGAALAGLIVEALSALGEEGRPAPLSFVGQLRELLEARAAARPELGR